MIAGKMSKVRVFERVRWLEVGPDKFVPTGRLRVIQLRERFLAADHSIIRRPRALDWVVVVVGLADRHGKPLADERTVERRFMELRAVQAENPEATFRYQEGLYGGYRERSVAIEVWPERDEPIDTLVDRVVGIIGTILAETAQEKAVMQTWVDGRLRGMDDLVREE